MIKLYFSLFAKKINFEYNKLNGFKRVFRRKSKK